MPPNTITVQATLQPDGMALQLEQKLPLRPGKVTVTVQPSKHSAGPTMLEVLDRIHREQHHRKRPPMTDAEMAAEIRQRLAEEEEYENRCRQLWSQTDRQNQGGEQS